MNKRFIILAALSLLPGIANAQAAFESELDNELSAVSSQPQEAQSAPTAAAIAPSGSANGQPIYILNQATPTANAQLQQTQTQTDTQAQVAVQKQPQVDVVSSPLSKSKAEQIRDARQQAEVETENKIVEKLEASRMEDERKRADALFGKPFENLSNQPQAQPVQQPAPQPIPVQPVQVVQPVVTPAPAPTPALDREAVREEIQAAMAMKAEIEAEQEPEAIEQKYFSANVGIGDYTDVRNVRGNYLLGASFGTKFDDTYAIEGSFIYSDYSVEPIFGGQWYPWGYVPRLVDTKQYSGAVTVKYFFLNGVIKPVIGGTAQYSYRTFGWSNDPYTGYGSSSDAASSHAIDLGAVVGADLNFNKKWTIGFEYKYMFNLASRVNNDRQSMFLTQPEVFGKPIEKLSYSMMSLVLRANF